MDFIQLSLHYMQCHVLHFCGVLFFSLKSTIMFIKVSCIKNVNFCFHSCFLTALYHDDGRELCIINKCFRFLKVKSHPVMIVMKPFIESSWYQFILFRHILVFPYKGTSQTSVFLFFSLFVCLRSLDDCITDCCFSEWLQ